MPNPDPKSHHGPRGRFRNPWRGTPAAQNGTGDLLKWLWERWRNGRAPDPSADDLPRAEPALAEPRIAADAGAVRITWVGHATFLIQMPGFTLLTDPVFSRRASPVQWAGPARFSPPGLTLDALPPVDAVLLSHDHYDHLDAPTVVRLRDRFGDDLAWFTSLGYTPWFERRGIGNVTEMDWWDERRIDSSATPADATPADATPADATPADDTPVDATPGHAGGPVIIRALPARHWTRRRMLDARSRLWGSWSVEAGGRRIYFGGDSGYTPAFAEIGARAGPFDVALLPIGAYEPRWFMRSSHMNPEEAVQACRDVRAEAMVGMHWGTFRLTDEPPLEPPVRTRRAWVDLGLEPAALHIPAVGQTVTV